MPITIKEQLGRRLGDDRAERIYLVLATALESNARSAGKRVGNLRPT